MWERNSALDLLFGLPVGLVTVDLHLSAYKASPKLDSPHHFFQNMVSIGRMYATTMEGLFIAHLDCSRNLWNRLFSERQITQLKMYCTGLD